MAVYGSRASIGLIVPASGYALEMECNKMAPEGVAVATTRIPLEKATPEFLSKIASYVEEAAKLLAMAELDVIVLGCTAGSFIKGVGYDSTIIKIIEEATNITGLTTSTAVISALRKLKAKKISIATPYIDEVNEQEKMFFEANGFNVLSIEGLQLGRTNSRDMPLLEAETMYDFAKKVHKQECDVLFVSCTGLGVISIIERLENELGKPVVTSNQATFWAALRTAKVRDPIEGYGKLLRES